MGRLAWDQLLNKWEGEIRAGNTGAVRAALSQLTCRSVPAAHRTQLSKLFVRVNLPHKAVEVLAPSVRINDELRKESTTEERLAYAIALIRVGSRSEASLLLSTLDAGVPERHLYEAYIEQTKWDYAAAIPLIEKYLSIKPLADYERAVARLNLLACLINANDLHRADSLQKELAGDVKAKGWLLLEHHMSELSAQVAMAQKDWKRARHLLEAAEEQSGVGTPVSRLLLSKWQAYIDLVESPDSTGAMEKVRKAAVDMAHWETARDCDRIVAEVRRDQNLFDCVYAGTPYASFRRRMMNQCSEWAAQPSVFLKGDANGTVLDLRAGLIVGRDTGLKPGQILHRALSLLAADFYRPISIGHLFAELFPGEYFNAKSSPARVHSVVWRLRQWLIDNKLPLKIENVDGGFLIPPWTQPFAIFFSSLTDNLDASAMAVDGTLSRLRMRLEPGPFGSVEVAKALGVSKSSAVRILSRAVDQGVLSRTGNRRNTVYKWVA